MLTVHIVICYSDHLSDGCFGQNVIISSFVIYLDPDHMVCLEASEVVLQCLHNIELTGSAGHGWCNYWHLLSVDFCIYEKPTHRNTHRFIFITAPDFLETFFNDPC